ncbi:MAG: hypothetical protein Q4D62_14020 [Planctomycetia bacterium]|nr:hypothetical protein [Planctomycetia bacterium]
MFDKIKEKLQAIVTSWFVKNLTVENVRAILEKVVADLKEKAAETENCVDDWAVEFLEMCVGSDEKMKIIVDKIKSLLPVSDGAVYMSSMDKDSDDWGQMAVYLSCDDAGVYGDSTAAIGSIVLLLQLIIPILAKFFGGIEEREHSCSQK